MAGFAPAACRLPSGCTSRCASTAEWHPRSESNTRNLPSEGRRRSSVGVGMNLAPVSGVEPLRSAFVARSPKSLGPRAKVGCSPGCRTQPSPLIWQLSRAYKARPHAGDDYNGCGGWTCTTTGRFMRPVHRYLCYATEMAPREVLAPSSLPLQGSACAISAIEAKLVRPARVELARRRHSPLTTACLPIPPRAYGADPRTCTEMQLGLSQSGLLIPFRSANGAKPRTRTGKRSGLS